MWLVELSGLQDGRLLVYAIAEALHVTDHTARPQTRVLTEHLEDKRLLLVLDTCEHLVDACPVLATLLRGAPGLHILATSRRPSASPTNRSSSSRRCPSRTRRWNSSGGARSPPARLRAHRAGQADGGADLRPARRSSARHRTGRRAAAHRRPGHGALPPRRPFPAPRRPGGGTGPARRRPAAQHPAHGDRLEP
ncbi:hypothetical protein NKH77_03625 [Streptomyces sp. M19]